MPRLCYKKLTLLWPGGKQFQQHHLPWYPDVPSSTQTQTSRKGAGDCRALKLPFVNSPYFLLRSLCILLSIFRCSTRYFQVFYSALSGVLLSTFRCSTRYFQVFYSVLSGRLVFTFITSMFASSSTACIIASSTESFASSSTDCSRDTTTIDGFSAIDVRFSLLLSVDGPLCSMLLRRESVLFTESVLLFRVMLVLLLTTPPRADNKFSFR